MTCPVCQSELVKGKTGYLCLNCGYAGKSTAAAKASKSAKAAKTSLAASTPKPPEPTAEPIIAHPAIHHAHGVHPQAHDHAHDSTEAMVEKELSRHPDHVAIGAAAVHFAKHQPVADDVMPMPKDMTDDEPIPKAPRPKKPAKPVRTITLVVVAVIVVAALLAAYILPARAASHQFNDKLAAANSFHFAGTLKVTGSSFLSVLNSNLNFSGNYTKKGQGDQIDYNGVFASRSYTGSLIATGGNLYSKISGSDMPFIRYNQGIATYHLNSGDWYSNKIDSSLYKYYCETKPDTKYPSPLIWYQAIRQIKNQPSALIAYDQKVDGHVTTHLRGSFAGKDISSAWNNINSSLPTGCEWNNLLGDISDIKVNYDLFTSKNYDEIQLHFNNPQLGVSGELVATLDQYDVASTVTAPSGAISLSNIFAVRAAIQARDYQRRTDIDALKVAVDKYYAANKNTLPSSLSKLTSKYIAAVPKDPNGSAYKYTVTKKTYTLSATLEDSGQLYTVTGP